MPHPDLILAALPSSDDAPEITIVNNVVILGYPDHAAYSRRVSGDVEALRRVGGETLVESWSPASGLLDRHVHLRYVAAPAVEAPRPIAPAPVPASPSRRR